MANRESTTITQVTPQTPDTEPSITRSEVSEIQNQNPTLIAGDVQSMSFVGDLTSTLGQFNRGLLAVQGTVNNVRQFERIFNPGANRNNVTSDRAETAFARALTSVAKNMGSANFQKLSPLEQQVWATNETIQLDRLYFRMDGRSREMYNQIYHNVQSSLGSIRSGSPYSSTPWSSDPYQQNNPSNQWPSTTEPSKPRNTQTAEKAELAFYNEAKKAYQEIRSPAFGKLTQEEQALRATRELSEVQTKFNQMSPESQQRYQKVYHNLQRRLTNLGASSSMSSPNYSMQHPRSSRTEQNVRPTSYEANLTSTPQPTPWEQGLNL